MNTIDYNAYFRAGLVEGFQARGLSEKQAEFFVKQAEIEALGAMNPSEFKAGYDEELQKRAAGYAIVPMDDADDGDDEDDASVPAVADSDDESFLDKLKRWGLLAGVGAGGFALGNYWPNIRRGVSNALAAGASTAQDRARTEAGNAAPQTNP